MGSGEEPRDQAVEIAQVVVPVGAGKGHHDGTHPNSGAEKVTASTMPPASMEVHIAQNLHSYKHDNTIKKLTAAADLRAWFVRNEVVHGKGRVPVQVSAKFLTDLWEELCTVRQLQKEDKKGKQVLGGGMKKQSATSMEKLKRWIPPDHGWMKINVDGAYTEATGEAGIGIIIRDSFGRALLSSWRVIFSARNAEEVEALACLEGLALATEWAPHQVILESDCATVIQLMKSLGVQRSSVGFIIKEAQTFAA
ncbi:hypothetical protein EJB05_47228, partial [Eragrostis curvula]